MKNLIVIIIALFTFNNIQAQGIMKDPVSFKLKNGVEVIVAENSGMGKVLAAVKVEGTQLGTNEVLTNGLENMLNEGTKVAFATNVKDFGPKVSLVADEVHVSADTEDFDKAFMVMANALKSPVMNEGNIVPSKTYITIAGDITVAQAKALAKKAFGEWKENRVTELAK